MKIVRRSHSLPSIVSSEPASTQRTFLFYEKQSGITHFQIAADSDGRLPLEQAACLLAMHCMVRGQTPEDYTVMVEAEQGCTDGLIDKAQKLLEAGQAVKSEVKVTRREEEVLRGILRGFANKEIAGDLNLSERTVKFHVSSLLSKFRVRGRMELVREASRFANWVVPKPVIPATREARPANGRIARLAPQQPQQPVFSVANLEMTV
ncbi:MAG TPA: LuxR C-terminal-related transcriptional regulator [Candidatus Acidoferrum sp.]|nr:LuxR C-terminal-related transcriptional regulator [Candidatus Acidoferrum sp.]